MFEQQVEMERRSNIVPLLLIVALVLAIASGLTWIVLEAKKKLTPEQANVVLTDLLKGQGPAAVHFHTGLVKPSMDEKPRDPHYRLLQKAGILKLSDAKDSGVLVAITDVGARQLERYPELQKGKNTDGTEAYTVPLASRELVKVNSITMRGSKVATVEYEWKWKPTALGVVFDPTSSAVKSFNQWDRATLIQKYGVDFYNAEPKKNRVTLLRNDNEWKVSFE